MRKTSIITKLKILILEYGIKFEPYDMFMNFPQIEKYKTKTIVKNPVSNGIEVYDISDDDTLIPSEIILKDKTRQSLVKCRYNIASPVEIKKDDKFQKFNIFLNGEKIAVNCELVEINKVLDEKISDEFKVSDFVDIVGEDRISILLFEGCYNWVCGKQCKFCDLHPKRATEKQVKPTINTLHKFKDVESWWLSYRDSYFKNIKLALDKILLSCNLKHKHLLIMAGNLTDSKSCWKCLLDLAEFLHKNYDMSVFDSYVNVCPHDNMQNLQKLKDFGLKQVQYNLEISNKDMFLKTCPGKISYDEFKGKLFEAVRVFGAGNVRSNMVLGLQDIDELISDTEFFAKNGVVFDYSIFQPKKHTPYENYPAPKTEDVLKYTYALADIYKKYSFKPIYCSISSRSSIINEVFEDVCK